MDAKDWTRCRRYFAGSIDVDFSSLAGGSPATMPADDLLASWSANLFADTRTLHMRSNHQVDLAGDTATVISMGYALNALSRERGSDVWEVWGTYAHTLARTHGGWQRTEMTLAVTCARGNETVRTYQSEA